MTEECKHSRTVPVVDKDGKPDNFAPLVTNNKPMSRCLDSTRGVEKKGE